MKPIKLMLLMIMVLSFNKLNCQDTQKLLFMPENDAQKVYMTSNGIQNTYIIYQGSFVSNDTIFFNKKNLETALNTIIPNVNDTGYAVLDWEGEYYNTIAWKWNKVPKKDYNLYVNRFLSALRYAKLKRPNVKWSMAGFPPWAYTTYKEGNKSLWKGFMPILKELDYLDAGMYLMSANQLSDPIAYKSLNDNILYSLELGARLNKPVYTKVWHRYSGTNRLYDVSVFKELIRRCLNTQYHGRKENGIMWWSCEEFIYSLKDKDTIVRNEYNKVVGDVSTYQMNLIKTYFDSIKPLFGGNIK